MRIEHVIRLLTDAEDDSRFLVITVFRTYIEVQQNEQFMHSPPL